jgi:hypothetical protein
VQVIIGVKIRDCKTTCVDAEIVVEHRESIKAVQC